ncbi:MAG: type II toxin-antitoxin system VapB family antitoxin [Deltaproteobacteria bacterium]|nr:type II toxin-antitoxin system VapB family antitoxin [Deltaproteobacteria bacterium]
MKRTTLMLNEEILKEAVRFLHAKTYSEAVNKALEEAIRLAKIRGLDELIGSGAWSGNLSVMREDLKSSRKRRN